MNCQFCGKSYTMLDTDSTVPENFCSLKCEADDYFAVSDFSAMKKTIDETDLTIKGEEDGA